MCIHMEWHSVKRGGGKGPESSFYMESDVRLKCGPSIHNSDRSSCIGGPDNPQLDFRVVQPEP